jgi:hypothetical protein
MSPVARIHRARGLYLVLIFRAYAYVDVRTQDVKRPSSLYAGSSFVNLKTFAAGAAAISLLAPSGGGQAVAIGVPRTSVAGAPTAAQRAALKLRNETLLALRKRVKYVRLLLRDIPGCRRYLFVTVR